MNKLLYIALFGMLFGCQNVERPEKPENLIPEETMVSLLAEIYLGNAARSINNKRIREQGIKLDSFLFAKYDVDSLQFAKSNAYYAADLNTYNAMFEKVTAYLERLKEAENERKLKEDTIKNSDKVRRDASEAIEQELDTNQTTGLLESAIESDTIK